MSNELSLNVDNYEEQQESESECCKKNENESERNDGEKCVKNIVEDTEDQDSEEQGKDDLEGNMEGNKRAIIENKTRNFNVK